MSAARAGGPASDVASAGTPVTGAPSAERRRTVAAGARCSRGADDAELGVEPGPWPGAAGPTGVGPAEGGDGAAGCAELRGTAGSVYGRAGAAIAGAGVAETGAPRPDLVTSRVTLR
ncbi:hypothetical protein FHS39_002823 [Streptomyces olivoverticillatus]|uniref:Uncharacterized protein n=1 Tax=Streptomyces olivoverticillatus TaxID=66427 RepID=A0A7W7PL10_9ACTN|nr:hypothetical protein [Streptomyces olivoverticillatus]MBB4893792.1 hypothetical protein [Streptomyces olivoverticillatus]